MDKNQFIQMLQAEVATFNKAVATTNGDWIIKGFIDVARNIYTISVDTKVISKIMELLLFPEIASFAKKNGLKMVLAEQQNFYPDISFIDEEGNRFALDIKSTYRTAAGVVNGMTLGAFTGYFRDRHSTKNITFPYASYAAHLVLGIIYSRAVGEFDERRKYGLDELEQISSVVTDLSFLYKRNIGLLLTDPAVGTQKTLDRS